MIKCLFVLLLVLSFNNLNAQTLIKKYVKENTAPIATINPDSTNFSDLQVIGDAIGNARIVMLGEQDHGDAPTFLAKTKLIKYLHEKKGFNVLAFESDFFGLNEGWDELNKTENNLDNFIAENIFEVWTGCDACKDLFYQYIPDTYTTEHPIILTGFDSQLGLGYTRAHLRHQLDSLFKRLKLPIVDSPDYTTKILPLFDDLYNTVKAPGDSIFYTIHSFYFKVIKSQLSKRLDNTNFWMMVMDNLLSNNLMLHYRFTGKYNYLKFQDTRDEQMAKNLKWLCEVKYPHQKIIVWAHNVHVSKYNGHYPQSFLNQMKTMGGVFTSDGMFMKETYILGFTSYEGTAGRLFHQQYQLPEPKRNSLERWINPAYQYAFIDFKPFRKQYPKYKKQFFMAGSILGNEHHTISKARWDKIFDGVFFIRKMYPCKNIN